MASDRAGIRSTPPPPDALAHRPAGAASQWDDVGLQKLWLATQKRQWRSLAVVAGSKGVPTLEVADTLAKIAWWYRGQPTCVVDLRDLSLRLVEHQLQEIASQTQHGERVIIALRSVAENPTVVPVAELADAVIMCVELGKTSMGDAKKAVDEIGRGRFLGTIVLNPQAGDAGKGAAAKPAK
jgi:Mrp family chromosome partitioning ATPase